MRFLNKRKFYALAVATLLGVAASGLSADATPELEEVVALLDDGKVKKALRRIDAYLDGTPDDARGRFLKARALELKGRRDEAEQVYRHMLRDFPDLPEPYVNLAVLAAEREDYAQARALLNSALRVNSTCEAAYDNLAELHATLATQAYQSALSVKAKAKTPKLAVVAMLNSDRPLNGVAVPKQPEPKPTSAETVGETPAAAAVKARIDTWAQAWSERDVDTYLSHYAQNFKPADMALAEWTRQRRARLQGKSFIEVAVRNVDVIARGDRAVAMFEQSYKSNTFADTVRKTLVMSNSEDGWQITREFSEKSP